MVRSYESSISSLKQIFREEEEEEEIPFADEEEEEEQEEEETESEFPEGDCNGLISADCTGFADGIGMPYEELIDDLMNDMINVIGQYYINRTIDMPL